MTDIFLEHAIQELHYFRVRGAIFDGHSKRVPVHGCAHARHIANE
jgi:hypothetical protein